MNVCSPPSAVNCSEVLSAERGTAGPVSLPEPSGVQEIMATRVRKYAENLFIVIIHKGPQEVLTGQ